MAANEILGGIYMVYETFLSAVRSRLQDILGPDHDLEIHPVPKNNGVVLDGLSDHAHGTSLAPTIYLNAYYEQLTDGNMTFDEICRDIERLFSDNPPPESIHTEDLTDFSKMKSHIMMKLIHAESNRKLLADLPYLPYLDLAVVFYLFLERNEHGQMTAMIHKDHIADWNIDEQGLLSLALQNTPTTYPEEIRSMSRVLHEIARNHLGDEFNEEEVSRVLDEDEAASSLYVLSNHSGIYGASCILYPEVLKNFADYLGSDLIVIPSSVHEVLLTPLEEDVDFKELNDMVVTINQYEVLQEERLSNHVYCYRRAQNQLSIPLVS
jgi:hypothetical protein